MSEQDIQKQLGQFIERKMYERERYLKESGKIKRNRAMSRTQLAEMVGVSKMWITQIINGEKAPSNEVLLKIANVLNINEHEIFKTARRIHPNVLERYKKEYLGEYYIGSCDGEWVR